MPCRIRHTYPNRVEIPPTGKLSVRNVLLGVKPLARLILRCGLLSDYREVFWKMAKPALKDLDIEMVIHVSLVSHHMIQFAREAEAGYQNASFYSREMRQPA